MSVGNDCAPSADAGKGESVVSMRLEDWGLEAVAPRPRNGPSGKVVVCRICRQRIKTYHMARYHLAKHFSISEKELARIDILVQEHVAALKPWAMEWFELRRRKKTPPEELEAHIAGRPPGAFESGFGPLAFVRLAPGLAKWTPQVAHVREPSPWDGGMTYDEAIGGAA